LPVGPMLLPGGVVLAVGVASFMRAPLLPEIGNDLRVGAADLALITTAFAIGRLIMDLPAGRLADRLPPGPALAGTGLGVAISAAILGTAQSLAQAMVGVFFLGVASSLTNTTGMTLFATSAPAARRGAAMAGFSMALMTGQTLGPAVGGLIAGIGGWRAAQAVAVAIGIGVMIVCLTVRAGRGRPAETREHAADGDPVLSRTQAAALAAVPFAVFFTLGALPQTLLPIIGSGDLDLSATAIGVALGAGGIVRFAGSAATGRLSDRVSRKAALVPSLVVMSAAVAILAWPPTVATWLLTILLLSIASSGIAVAATIIADQVPAGTVGRRLGTFRFTGDLGLLAGPAVTGLLYQHSGRASAMLVAAAVLAACALATGFLIEEPRRSFVNCGS
jgi:MFS transporter, DHA1 family, multidrug resistance protein